MKFLTGLFGRFDKKLGVCGAALIGICAMQAPAWGQAAYGSYIGVGPGVAVSNDNNGDGGSVSAVVAGRYKFLRAPVSLRAQAFIGNGTAIVPTISYDYALNWQTDIYIGAGASIPLGGDTVLGDRTSFAIQPGIDYALPNSNVVVFGNAVIAFDGYKSGGAAATLQGGVGLRF
ncbi:MAG: porin family protein [Leptolyngbya sp. Prado105]|jgi:hypothetical protein|nr:porin family protein [Leptolyngbya sp. Prado105]